MAWPFLPANSGFTDVLLVGFLLAPAIALLYTLDDLDSACTGEGEEALGKRRVYST